MIRTGREAPTKRVVPCRSSARTQQQAYLQACEVASGFVRHASFHFFAGDTVSAWTHAAWAGSQRTTALRRVLHDHRERGREREGRKMAGVHGAGGDAAGLRTFEDAKSTLYGTISAAGAALEKASKCVNRSCTCSAHNMFNSRMVLRRARAQNSRNQTKWNAEPLLQLFLISGMVGP